jgi:Flp pilus assembly protein TadG
MIFRVTSLPRPIYRLTLRLRRLVRDARGVAAVEFAMLLPLMVTLYLGGVEISQGIAIDRKVTLTSRTLADLSSQGSNINNATMSNIFNATTAVMSPYPVINVKATVTCVTIDSNGKATVKWSDTLNGTARAVGASVNLPAALNVPSTTLIWSEVEYNYKPTVGYIITGTLKLKDQIYMRPRLSDTIDRVNS